MASASGPSGFAAPDSSTWRITSAPGDPPGSRVSTTPIASDFSRSTSAAAWVDLPDPSPPSNVMNRPRIFELSPALARAGFAFHLPGAGADQADHHLGRGVERALRQAAGTDGLARLQLYLVRQGIAAPHPQQTDPLALIDRHRERPAIGDPGDNALVHVAWNHDAHELRRDQRHAAAHAAIDLGLADLLPLGEQRAHLE